MKEAESSGPWEEREKAFPLFSFALRRSFSDGLGIGEDRELLQEGHFSPLLGILRKAFPTPRPISNLLPSMLQALG